jgi:hypothetical protein
MAQPTGSDLHVNTPLTNISVAYMQSASEFIADQVFPQVPVSKASDVYYKYDKGNWFRTAAQERAPATESVGTSWTVTTDQYLARVFAVHKDVADQDRARQDSPVLDLDRDATEIVTRDLLILREKKFITAYFGPGIWTGTTDQTGVASAPAANQFLQFNDVNSNPIEVIRAMRLAMAAKTGLKPNKLVVGPQVHNVLVDHIDVIDRIKYTQKGIVTSELLASLFEVDQYLVPMVVENTSQEGSADSINFMYGKSMLLAYAPPNPGLMIPSAGYIFPWTGYIGAGAYGNSISRFRMDALKSDRVEGEMAFDIKLVSPDLGQFFTAVVV